MPPRSAAVEGRRRASPTAGMLALSCHYPSVLFFLCCSSGDRRALLNDTKHQIDFKSHQWFGATVRSHGDTILVSVMFVPGLNSANVLQPSPERSGTLCVLVAAACCVVRSSRSRPAQRFVATPLQMFRRADRGAGKTSAHRNAYLIHHQPPHFDSYPHLLLPQACAPLYSWRTEKDLPHSDATGTCYLSAQNFTKFVEYAPCRTGNRRVSQGNNTNTFCCSAIDIKYMM